MLQIFPLLQSHPSQSCLAFDHCIKGKHDREQCNQNYVLGDTDTASYDQYETCLGEEYDDEDNLDEDENPPGFDFDYVVILARNKFILTMKVCGEYQNTKYQIIIWYLIHLDDDDDDSQTD